MGKDNTKKQHNISALNRLIIDGIVGTTAGFTLTWFITPMDAAVMESMSGKASLFKSLSGSFKTILKSPASYLRRPAFGFVAGTYIGTYLSKNFTDSFCILTNQTAEQTAFIKFWFVFAVNGGLSVFWKDPGLAKIYGTKPPTNIPKQVYVAWACRDTLHMIGAAVLPDYCEEKFGWTKEQWRIAQLTFPLVTQCVTTPAHLFGLDYYNNISTEDNKIKFFDRFNRVVKAWIPSTGIRMVRMFAPWSIGLLINRDLRELMLDKASDPTV